MVAILGPTAVGKTGLSLEIGRELDAEIVSVDSRLIYRGMDIGTAKPTPDQLRQLPHHLVDVADPSDPWSLARFKAAAEKAIAEIGARRRLPLLVGGTGQYLKAILQGWDPPPRPQDDRLRVELEALANEIGAEKLHAELARIDPQRAAQIDARNIRRVVRALEIYRLTGAPPSELAQRSDPAFASMMVGLALPRKELFRRIDQRIDSMLQRGWVDEVKRLLAGGVDPNSPAMSAIGYQQILGYLNGEISLEDARRQIRKQTRQFVRRQANWFKKDDPGIQWFEAKPESVPEIVQAVRIWLSAESNPARGKTAADR